MGRSRKKNENMKGLKETSYAYQEENKRTLPGVMTERRANHLSKNYDQEMRSYIAKKKMRKATCQGERGHAHLNCLR